MCTEPKLTSNWRSRADTLSLPLLPACVFIIRDTVRHPRHRSSSETFFARKICLWTGAFVKRGSTVLCIAVGQQSAYVSALLHLSLGCVFFYKKVNVMTCMCCGWVLRLQLHVL
jgi:hypothetical protein